MMRRIKLGYHTWFQIKMVPVTSLHIVITSLALSGFVLLCYYYCGVFSDSQYAQFKWNKLWIKCLPKNYIAIGISDSVLLC